MKETIAEMLKVEAKAKEIVAAAREQAQDLNRKARTDASAVEQEAQRQAQAEAAQVLEQGLREARERRADMLAHIDRDNERLRDLPQDKVAAAKHIILSAVVGKRRFLGGESPR